MDVQKAREAFEKLSEIAEILKNKTIKFVEKTNKYYSYHYSVEYLNGAWMAWQAKAQALPEGFVLASKEPSADLVNHGHQVFLGHFNEGGQTGGRSLYFAYKAMIEAQEQAND